MECTNDYSIFKKFSSNRDVKKENLAKLIIAVEENNLLHIRPILVDRQLRVIDGQTRLEAAKYLNVPIYYEIFESENLPEETIRKMMIDININQKNWELQDYLDHYISIGKIEYEKFRRFMTDNEFNFSNAFIVLKQRSNDTQSKFRRGNYTFPENLEKINETIQEIAAIKRYIKTKSIEKIDYLSSVSFMRALIRFLSRNDVAFPIFMRKIEQNLAWLKTCPRSDDYLMIFSKIYNYRNQFPII